MRQRTAAIWVCGYACVLIGTATAQDSYKPVKKPDIDNSYLYRDLKEGKASTLEGNTVPEAKKAAMKATSEWIVYRLTDPTYSGELTSDPKAPTYAVLIKEFAEKMPAPPVIKKGDAVNGGNRNVNIDNQLDFIREFGKICEANILEVMKHPKPVVRVNAGRMLVILGTTGYTGLAETCAKMLADEKEADVNKLFAAEALGNLFALPNLEEPNNSGRSIFVKKDDPLEKKAILALYGFIARKSPLAPTASAEEVAGLQFVRRQAIRALGTTRYPVIRERDTVVATPGALLLQIALHGGVSPEPSVAERLEALNGFFRLQLDPKYDAEAVALYAGTAAVELARDLTRTDDRRPPQGVVPWKYEATRMNMAIAEWKARLAALNLPKAQLDIYTELAIRLQNGVFLPIEKEGGKAQLDRVVELAKWLPKKQAPLLLPAIPGTALQVPAGG